MLALLMTLKDVWLNITERRENTPIWGSHGFLSILKISLPEKRHLTENSSLKAGNQNSLSLILLTAGRAFRSAEGSWVRAPAGSQGSIKAAFFFSVSNPLPCRLALSLNWSQSQKPVDNQRFIDVCRLSTERANRALKQLNKSTHQQLNCFLFIHPNCALIPVIR